MNRHFIEEPLARLGERKPRPARQRPRGLSWRAAPGDQPKTGKMRYNPPEPAQSSNGLRDPAGPATHGIPRKGLW